MRGEADSRPVGGGAGSTVSVRGEADSRPVGVGLVPQ